MDRRLARAHAQRLDAAFERGDAALQHGRRRIADARVAVALDLEIEQRRAVIGAVERVGDGLVDRHGHGLRRRIDVVAAVNGDRLAFHVVHLAVMPQSEPVISPHDPLDVGLRRPETGDARAQDRRAVAEADLGHPGDLPLVERGEELAGDEAVPGEAHERQRRAVDDAPSRALERLAQHVAHARLVLDHLDVPGFAVLGEREKQLQADEPARPLHRGRVRIDDRLRRSFPACRRSARGTPRRRRRDAGRRTSRRPSAPRTICARRR